MDRMIRKRRIKGSAMPSYRKYAHFFPDKAYISFRFPSFKK
jgi:hypothetical protein